MRSLAQFKYLGAVAVLLGVMVAGAAEPKNVASKKADRLQAVKVKAPPKLDGQVDELWKQAKPLTIKVIDGANLEGGETEVTLRAVYTPDTVYFLAQYKDPTQSFRRAPWQKQPDGSWQKLKDPDDKGGDKLVPPRISSAGPGTSPPRGSRRKGARTPATR